LNAPVYNFIERFAVKNVNDVNQLIKPHSKEQIAEQLPEIRIKHNQIKGKRSN